MEKKHKAQLFHFVVSLQNTTTCINMYKSTTDSKYVGSV